jgi:hypothetical protein
MRDITVHVNGTPHSLDVDSRMSLPGLLRQRPGCVLRQVSVRQLQVT